MNTNAKTVARVERCNLEAKTSIFSYALLKLCVRDG